MQIIIKVVMIIVVMNIIHIFLNIFQYGFVRTNCIPIDLSIFIGIISVFITPICGIVILLLFCMILYELTTQTINSDLIFSLFRCMFVSESISDKEY